MMQTQLLRPHFHRVHQIIEVRAARDEGRSILSHIQDRRPMSDGPKKMASESNKTGTWNLGFGSNMSVKNVTGKKLVKVLGTYTFCR